MKKRGIDASAFHDHALRVAAVSGGDPGAVVAVARAGDAAPPRLLTRGEWTTFCKQFDSNIMTLSALQTFVVPAGGVGTVYRNDYCVTNQQGKVVTGTTKHACVPCYCGLHTAVVSVGRRQRVWAEKLCALWASLC